jgi:ribosomal protein S18 acetylase RimI-like enzyme
VSALSWFFGSFAARLALRYGHVLTTPEGTAGLLLFAPGKSPSVAAVIQAGVLSLPRRFGMRGAWRALLLGMHLERQRLKLAPVPHFYVIAVGVTPSRQGQGVGSALLRQIIQQCDSENTPCYLEVFEDLLVDRYRQMGFRVLQQETLANGLTLWCMLRQAGAERAN